MKWLQAVIIIASFILISVSLTYAFYNNYMLIEVDEIPFDFVVMDHIAVNADSDAIHLGGFPPESASGKRKITITNRNQIPVRVSILAKGLEVGWINVEDNNFWLDSAANRTIEINAAVPKGTEYRKYEGILVIEYKRR